MRAIHMAPLDKLRPALVLTRSRALGRLSTVTVAAITSTIHGVATEVLVDESNGLQHLSAINLENVFTIRYEKLGRHLGYLRADQEDALHAGLARAFDLS
jgi:mRNA interferase MazF